MLTTNCFMRAIFYFPFDLKETHNSRFNVVQQRPGIRSVVSEKFIETFQWYEMELEEIQGIYERNKVLGPETSILQ